MDELTTTAGLVAIAAAVVALLAVCLCLVLRRRVVALRAAQTAILGDGSERDLVAHAERLDRRIAALSGQLESSTARLDARDAELAELLAGAVTHCGVVRYDALGEMGGRQSSSVALLDSHRCGVVLSSILHREQARLYAKQVTGGRSEIDLSPEEQQALAAALEPDRG